MTKGDKKRHLPIKCCEISNFCKQNEFLSFMDLPSNRIAKEKSITGAISSSLVVFNPWLLISVHLFVIHLQTVYFPSLSFRGAVLERRAGLCFLLNKSEFSGDSAPPTVRIS